MPAGRSIKQFILAADTDVSESVQDDLRTEVEVDTDKLLDGQGESVDRMHEEADSEAIEAQSSEILVHKIKSIALDSEVKIPGDYHESYGSDVTEESVSVGDIEFPENAISQIDYDNWDGLEYEELDVQTLADENLQDIVELEYIETDSGSEVYEKYAEDAEDFVNSDVSYTLEGRTKYIGFNFDPSEVQDLDSQLGVDNIDSKELVLLQVVSDRIEQIDNYDGYHEAVSMLSNIEELISSAAEDIIQKADNYTEIVIDITDINHIKIIRDEIASLLNKLGYDPNEAMLDRFLELILNEKLAEHIRQTKSADIDVVNEDIIIDIGTHEYKTDSSLTSVDNTSVRIFHPFFLLVALGRFALIG